LPYEGGKGHSKMVIMREKRKYDESILVEMEVRFFLFRILSVLSVDSYNDTSGETDRFIISEEMTADQIHQKVIDLQNERKNFQFPPNLLIPNKIKYAYWVDDYENMADNRDEFGHESQVSEKLLKQSIPKTYTRGVVKSLGEFINASGEFPDAVNKKLDRFIKLMTTGLGNVGKDGKKRNELDGEYLSRQIVMIEGMGERESFFEEFGKDYRLKMI